MTAKPYALDTHRSGLTVLTIPRQETEAVTVEFLFRAGARYETAQTNGLAHFTEHMVFKGAKHFPDFRSVNDAVNQVGGYFNAYTSDEVTAFFVRCGAANLEVALDVLSDILTTPTFAQVELDRERGVICSEIDMYEDDPASQVPVLLDQIMYPEQALGRPVLGPKRNIRSFNRQAFIRYREQYLTPDRAVLVIAGNLDTLTDQVLDCYLARFSGTSTVVPQPADTSQQAAQLAVRKRQTEQTHIGIALRGPALTDRERSYALDVLATILGGNTSSRLFTEVRERQGLAYAVHANPEQLTDAGSLDIYAGVAHDKAPAALGAILHELQRLRDGDLSDAELRIGKESLRGMRALRWEDTSALVALYGLQQLLLGQIITPHEILERLAAVSKEDVIAMAGQVVRSDGLNIGIIGPHRKSAFAKSGTLH